MQCSSKPDNFGIFSFRQLTEDTSGSAAHKRSGFNINSYDICWQTRILPDTNCG